jgi:hypothetical protein
MKIPIHSSTSKAKAVHASVGADLQMIMSCDQGLKVAKAAHNKAAKVATDWFAGIASETMQTASTLRANDPDDRV